jgi:hypothetical protein
LWPIRWFLRLWKWLTEASVFHSLLLKMHDTPSVHICTGSMHFVPRKGGCCSHGFEWVAMEIILKVCVHSAHFFSTAGTSNCIAPDGLLWGLSAVRARATFAEMHDALVQGPKVAGKKCACLICLTFGKCWTRPDPTVILFSSCPGHHATNTLLKGGFVHCVLRLGHHCERCEGRGSTTGRCK